MTSEYLSSDFSYKKYSLEHLENWLHDAIDCEDLTPQDIYETIVKCVDENVEYHKKYLTKNIEFLSLLKGNRPVNLSESVEEATKKDWVDFWEETYRPEQYTEQEMDAMCDTAKDKEKCREYNMREAEYYNKRAEIDYLYEEIKKAGGYDWTPSV
jgi:hypothetical protein